MYNSLGRTLPMLSYATQSGASQIVGPAPVGASEQFYAKGGKYVVQDGSGNVDLAGAADIPYGWACGVGDLTAGSSDGDTKIAAIDVNPLVIREMPADAAVTASLIGKTCDIVVSAGGIQQADVGSSSTDVLVIIDVDPTNQRVLVHLNPNKLYTTGVA